MIQKDKILHFGVCLVVATVFTILLNAVWSLLIVILIGISKEIHDTYFDVEDIFADLSGAILGIWVGTFIEQVVLH